MSRPRQYAAAAKAKRMTPDHFSETGGMVEDYDHADEPECPCCGGDGMDPMTDYLLPCPECQGEQRP